MTTPYDLYYWPNIAGRGEFVRLVLEEAAAPYRDVGRLPPEEGGGSGGPYLSKADDLLDPWDNPYIIKVPGDINQYDFDIVSAGEDGEFGTADDIAGPE